MPTITLNLSNKIWVAFWGQHWLSRTRYIFEISKHDFPYYVGVYLNTEFYARIKMTFLIWLRFCVFYYTGCIWQFLKIDQIIQIQSF